MDLSDCGNLDKVECGEYGYFPKIESLLDDHQEFHSALQIESFIIIKSGGTKYGMYKQALRELVTRLETLKSTHLEIEDLRKKCAVKGAQLEHRFHLNSKERVQKDRQREFCQIYAIACALKEDLGEITPSRRDQLEQDLWTFRVKRLCAIDLISHGLVTPEHFDMLKSMPNRDDLLYLAKAENRDQVITEYLEYAPELPEYEHLLLPFEEVKKLCP